MIGKDINLSKAYKVLDGMTRDESYPLNERVLIYRLISKLADSQSFENIVNRAFSAYKLSHDKDGIMKSIESRSIIELPCEFTLSPIGYVNWELHHLGEIFLDSLDKKLATKIAFDINVAFSIKVSRLSKLNNYVNCNNKKSTS